MIGIEFLGKFKHWVGSLFLGLLFLTSSITQTFSQTHDSSYVDGVLYFKVADTSLFNPVLNPNARLDFSSLILPFGIDTIELPFGGLNSILDKTFRVRFKPFSNISTLKMQLENLKYLEYVEMEPLMKVNYQPNDPQSVQWHLTKIMAFDAWDLSKGNSSVVIAIVDNAISTTHEDLIANLWKNTGEIAGNGLDDDLNGYTDDVNGYDVADRDGNPNPPPGTKNASAFIHGTHCAGIASATSDNNKGISSIGFNCKIMAVKCSKNSNPDDGGSMESAFDGVYYAIRAKANIISMSWGGNSGSFLTGENIIKAANSMGIVLIAAAGNNNNETPFYPASYNEVIGVGATDPSDKKAEFSNFGGNVTVMAPGTNIYSTLIENNNSYGSRNGTSMACPLTAGLAGLILSQKPGLNPSQVRNALVQGCDNIESLNPGYTGKLGAGRINAARSLGASVNINNLYVSAEKTMLFPNPGKEFIQIRNNNSPIEKIEIFNATGKFLKGFENTDNFTMIDFPDGFYFVGITTNSQQQFIKLILQK